MSRNDPEVAWIRAKLLRLILSKQQSLLPMDALYRSFSKHVVAQEASSDVKVAPPPHLLEEISRESLKALSASPKSSQVTRQVARHVPDNLAVKVFNSSSHFDVEKFLNKHSQPTKRLSAGDADPPAGTTKWKGSVRKALEEARVEAFGAVERYQGSGECKVHLKTIQDSNKSRSHERRTEMLAAILEAAQFWLICKKRSNSDLKKVSPRRSNHMKKVTRQLRQLEDEHSLESIWNQQTYKKVLNQDIVGYALAAEEHDTIGLSTKERILESSIEKLKAFSEDSVRNKSAGDSSSGATEHANDKQAIDASIVVKAETESEAASADADLQSNAGNSLGQDVDTTASCAGNELRDHTSESSDQSAPPRADYSVLNRLRAKSLSSVLEYVVSNRTKSDEFDVNRLHVRPKYVGQTVDGRREGLGILQFPQGPAFQGEWKQDLPCGAGVERYTDGTKYTGFFLEGMRDGLGIFTLPNKICYLGCWKGGKRCSVGLVAVQKDAAMVDSLYEMLPIIKLEFRADSDQPKFVSKFDKHDMSHTFLWSDAILAANFALHKAEEAETVVMKGFYKSRSAERSTENLGLRLRAMPSSVRAYINESFSSLF
eukprot:746189-Hanusia_phi.AAC.5